MSEEENFQHCIHVRELLDTEVAIIRKHLNRHKWFRHILDDELGMQDFIKEYGWIMKEMYCCFICKDREHCMLAEKMMLEGDSYGVEDIEE